MNQNVRDFTSRLEKLDRESNQIPLFLSRVIERRIQTARNLLFEPISTEWLTQMSMDILMGSFSILGQLNTLFI